MTSRSKSKAVCVEDVVAVVVAVRGPRRRCGKERVCECGMYGQVRSGRRIGRWGGEAESRQRRFLVCRRANPVPVVVAPSPILRFQTREGALARAHAHCNQGASLSLGMSSAQRSWRQERVKVNKVNKSGAPDCLTLLVRWAARTGGLIIIILPYMYCTSYTRSPDLVLTFHLLPVILRTR